MIVKNQKNESKIGTEISTIATQTVVGGCFLYFCQTLISSLGNSSKNLYDQHCLSPYDRPACFAWCIKKDLMNVINFGIDKVGGVFALALILVLTTNYGSLAYRKFIDRTKARECN